MSCEPKNAREGFHHKGRPRRGWCRTRGEGCPVLRVTTRLGDAISARWMAPRAYPIGVPMPDDPVDRLLPEDGSWLLLVVLEKSEPAGGKPGPAVCILKTT